MEGPLAPIVDCCFPQASQLDSFSYEDGADRAARLQARHREQAAAQERMNSERQERWQWTAQQAEAQLSARKAEHEREQADRDRLMQKIPDEERWMFGREL